MVVAKKILLSAHFPIAFGAEGDVALIKLLDILSHLPFKSLQSTLVVATMILHLSGNHGFQVL